MKTLLIAMTLTWAAYTGTAQTSNGNDIQLKDLGVKLTEPANPSIPDAKPADPPKDGLIEKAAEIYQSIGSPQPIIEDRKVIGGSVTIPI